MKSKRLFLKNVFLLSFLFIPKIIFFKDKENKLISFKDNNLIHLKDNNLIHLKDNKLVWILHEKDLHV
jgi:hypothetical protein